MSTGVSSHPITEVAPRSTIREVRVYSHSPIFYWWPVWAVGYLLALLTYLQGQPTAFTQPDFADVVVKMHPNRSLGVIFTFTFLLVVMITHFSVRGLASLVVILTGCVGVLLFAYMGWWDDILSLLGSLSIFMNLGFYVFFSTALFIVWLLAVVVFVRFDYYLFRPGQLAHVTVWGVGEKTYDTFGMSVEKMRDDLFRHWVLGLGSGDLQVATTGARKAEIIIPNVLFIGHKLRRIQRLVAMRPDESPKQVFTAGQPE